MPIPILRPLHPAISWRRKRAALAFTVLMDVVQWCLVLVTVEGAASPVEWFLDILTAFVLVCICGLKWQFILGFAVELIPGLDLFPTWTALMLTIPSTTTPPPAEDFPVLQMAPPPSIAQRPSGPESSAASTVDSAPETLRP
jgi:hypothetical protein